MADFPALPLWTDAYLADTRHLSTVEHGAYLLLLMEAWRRPARTLPDDDRLLARLAGLPEADWSEIRDVIMAFWDRDGRTKTWSQKRLFREASYVALKSRSQRDKAVKRWNNTKKDDATALPEGMPERCPDDAPTPTPTPSISNDIEYPPTPQGDLVFSPPPDEWKAFKDHRVKIKKPMTDHAQNLAIKSLEKLWQAGHEPAAVINQTILNGWVGLFPIKDENNGRSNSRNSLFDATLERERQDDLGKRR